MLHFPELFHLDSISSLFPSIAILVVVKLSNLFEVNVDGIKLSNTKLLFKTKTLTLGTDTKSGKIPLSEISPIKKILMAAIYDIAEEIEYVAEILIPKIDNNYIYWSSSRNNIGAVRIYVIGY